MVSIVLLRAQTEPEDLKELSVWYILERVREFYFTIINWEYVWCFRLFSPTTCPEYIELWSVVVAENWRKRGISKKMIEYTEEHATNVSKKIIAITGEKLNGAFEKQHWKSAKEHFPERMSESKEDKNLWIYPDL